MQRKNQIRSSSLQWFEESIAEPCQGKKGCDIEYYGLIRVLISYSDVNDVVLGMLKFFKKKGPKEKLPPQLRDLNETPLEEGDIVEALRYDLGKSKLLLVENSWVYESLDSGKQVSFVRMIDAISECQKVKKIEATE